eukprot:2779385-Rhodomonas_salina.2
MLPSPTAVVTEMRPETMDPAAIKQRREVSETHSLASLAVNAVRAWMLCIQAPIMLPLRVTDAEPVPARFVTTRSKACAISTEIACVVVATLAPAVTPIRRVPAKLPPS